MASRRFGEARSGSSYADSPDPTTERFTIGNLQEEVTAISEVPEAPPRLVCLIGPCANTAFRVGRSPQVIGRTADADIRIDSTDVSRRHARLEWRDGQLILTDLDSRNGTSVNGVPIGSQALEIGDRIQIGASTILVYARHDELEQRAQRLQKLEALAQLAGGMVHDFRNMLGVIGINTELLAEHLKQRSPDDTTAAEILGEIATAVDAAHAVTQRLLFFGRRDVPTDGKEVVVRTIVDDVVALVHRQFEGEHPVRIDIAVDARLTVRGRGAELQHALVNLLLNARDAMPQGGRVVIAARPVTLGLAEASRRHVSAGRHVELSVADTGIGMDDVTLARVFEPFFTTKPPREGTGLGLSTVYGIVRDHGGSIEVESRRGEGTCFRILLPEGGSP